MNTFKGTDPNTLQGHELPEGCPNMHKEVDCPLCCTGTLVLRGDFVNGNAPEDANGGYLLCIDCGARFRGDAITCYWLGDNDE